ncbi:MAG: hypothetical protein AB7Q97_09610 [Gammaproteobacteria bacterium]
MSNPGQGGGAVLAAAWEKYRADLEATRDLVLNSPFIGRCPQIRARSYGYLGIQQAYANNLVLFPDGRFPRLVPQDPALTVFLSNPDFFYLQSFLDGRYRYRVHGALNDVEWLALQVQNNRFGNDSCTLGALELDRGMVGADGGFEITLSAEPPASGHWIRLDPASRRNYLFVRRALSDWTHGRLADLDIEAIDAIPRDPPADPQADMAERLAYAGDMVRNSTGFWVREFLEKEFERAGGVNRLSIFGGESLTDQAASGFAVYGWMFYECRPGEAVIVESDLPPCVYWGAHLGDTLQQTHDWMHHKTSINRTQAEIGADGRLRMVISHEDPGVRNWLDPMGLTFGVLLMRWYKARALPQANVVRVPVAQVREHLPAGTAAFTPAQRAAEVAARAREIARLYWH